MKNHTNVEPHKREITLEDSEAEAGAPAAESVAGEEDPGAALEVLVELDKEQRNKHKERR